MTDPSLSATYSNQVNPTVSTSYTTGTNIQNPRRFEGPNAPKTGILRGTTADDVSGAGASKPTEDLTAADFGLVPGGRKLPGNTDDPKKQNDAAVKAKYDELRLKAMADKDDSEVGRLRRRIAELELAVNGRVKE